MRPLPELDERAGQIEARLAQIDAELTLLCLSPAPGQSPGDIQSRVRELHAEWDALDAERDEIRRDLAAPRIPFTMPRLIRNEGPAGKKSCQPPRLALLDEATKKAGTSRHVPAQAYDKDSSL